MEYGYWILMGVLAGFLAKTQFPAKRDENIFTLLVVGSIGALLGGWFIHTMSRGGGVLSLSVVSYVVAFVGATVLLLVMRAVTSPRTA